MTNETNYAPVRYGCNGVTVDFTFPWKIFENKDVIVQIQDSEGNISTLAYGVDYSVEFEAVGGNVKLKNVFEAGNIVIISRDVSDYQSKSFSTSPGFQASEIEKSLDRVSCNLQEMDYNIENFKETYSAQIGAQIEDLENVIEENKQEVLLIQERFEDSTNAAIKEFEDGIDAKIATVADAADRINDLDNDLAIATNAANEAISQAQIATQQAQIITNKVDEVLNVKDELEAEIGTKANVDLSNLSEIGEKHFLGKSQITNCIKEIPQRIKLELSDGVLTLKAGSELIIPNGFEADGTTPKFDYYTMPNDRSGGTGTNQLVYCYNPSIDEWGATNQGQCFSGDIAPSSPVINTYWYDTANNIIKRWDINNSIWKEGYCFPVCLSSNTLISQVFNGMGYIGSTVWVDKGVKVLIPDGRNKDGSLKNAEYTITSPILNNGMHLWDGLFKLNIMVFPEGKIDLQDVRRFSVNKKDSIADDIYIYSYNEEDNTWYYSQDNGLTWIERPLVVIGSLTEVASDKTVISFNPKQVFRAVDYNDLVSDGVGKPQISLDNNLPSGCVWLEGAIVSRTTYSQLFAIYGTTYGIGDGSTTFALPDFRNRAIWGASDFGYLSAGLPNITGTLHGTEEGTVNGAFSRLEAESNPKLSAGGFAIGSNQYFSASKSNAIYGASTTVQPPSIKVRVYTKYQ